MNKAGAGPGGLYVDQAMDQCALLPMEGHGQAVVYSTRSPFKPPPNEDAAMIFAVNQHAAILAVADGVGGGLSGEHASRITLECIRAAASEARDNETKLRNAILNAVEQANQKVIALGVGAATTLAVIEINQGRARPYHIGDSMILVTGQRGKCKLYTVSHAPVAQAVEAGMLDEDEAMHHEERHIVSNVIGMPGMRIEVGSSLKLAPRDTVIVATDGLEDNLNRDEIINIMRAGPLVRGADQLARQALQRMEDPREGQPSKPDDLTFIAYRPGSLS